MLSCPQANFFYTVDLNIGQPAQNLSVVFDTGSSDLVVNGANSDFCKKMGCADFGAYDVSRSSGYKWLSDELSTGYELGSDYGSWLLDTIAFQGNNLTNFQLGVANKSTTNPQNYWGFGFNPPGSSPGQPNTTTLAAMAQKGLIKSATAGIYLNRSGAATGSVTLGGFDSSLFTGKLQTFPIERGVNNSYDRAAINLTSVAITGGERTGNTSFSTPIRVLMDTGNFDIKLPASVVRQIYRAYNVSRTVNVKGLDFGLVPCALARSPQKLTFAFAPNFTIAVPAASLAIAPPPQLLTEFGLPANAIPPGACIFGVNAFSDQALAGGFGFILGAAFLQNAYMVLDVDNMEIGLAPASYAPGPSQIVGIGGGNDTSWATATAGMPVATANATGTTASATGSATGTAGSATATAAGSATGTAATATRSSGAESLVKGASVGLGLASIFFSVLF